MTLRLGATTTAVVGAAVLVVGWWGGVDIVTRVLPDLVSMKANTAAAFLLIGISLHPVVRKRSPAAADVVAIAAAAIGAATWLEYAAGLDLGIDELLASDVTAATRTSAPGRMGLNTAIGFTFLGSATLVAPPRRRRPHVAIALGAVPAVLSLMAFIAYLYGVTDAAALGSATEMALHTSVVFLFASVALAQYLLADGPLQPLTHARPTARVARRQLVSLAAAIVGAGLLVQLLQRAGVIVQPELQLAAATVISLIVGTALLLASAGAMDRLQGHLHRSNEELAASNERLQRATQELAELNEELETRVRRRTAALEASRAEFRAFAHGVAHDIKTPLTTLSGFLTVLQERGNDLDPDMQADLRDRSLVAAQRMHAMITDLLTFADQTADPTESVADLVKAARSAAGSLPPGRYDLVVEDLPRVRGNRSALQAILFNLFTNSLKYAHPDRPPRIRVTAQVDGPTVTVHVSDNGRGIDPSFREQVFRSGDRGGRDDEAGLGIGLATVARLVERHNGKVWIEDGPDGVGTTVAFTLLATDSPVTSD